ncbi:MAG: porin family protein [Croceitalea sp.]|nr:porin family protein [Croceitalea sp.]
MKKLIVSCFIFLGAFGLLKAQEGFAIKAGINNVTFDLDGFGSTSEMGFYLGGSYTFDTNGEIQIEPSVLVSIVDDLNALYIPVMAKYGVSDQFNLQAGPQINYILEDIDNGAFGLDLGLGAGFDISDKLFLEARYAFEIIRDLDNGSINTLTVGVGYRID